VTQREYSPQYRDSQLMHERAARALPCNPLALRERVAIPTNCVIAHHPLSVVAGAWIGRRFDRMYTAGASRTRHAAASAMMCGLSIGWETRASSECEVDHRVT